MIEHQLHRELGSDLMIALEDNFQGSSLIDVNDEWRYQELRFASGFSILYAKWKTTENNILPFYFIMYDRNRHQILDLDLSMLVESEGHFSWNLKNSRNLQTDMALEKHLGAKTSFGDQYVENVTRQKAVLQSGKRKRKNGYLFLNDVDWEALVVGLGKLVSSVFRAHGSRIQKRRETWSEVADDKGAYSNQRRRIRPGQQGFRRNLIELYDGLCAITAEGPIQALDAAHIVDHSKSRVNHTDNGILLRADLHSLFDQNLLRINPDSLKIDASIELRDGPYWKYHGKKIRKRLDGNYPGRKFLEDKWSGI